MFCCPSILLPAPSPMTTWDPFVPNTSPTIPTPALGPSTTERTALALASLPKTTEALPPATAPFPRATASAPLACALLPIARASAPLAAASVPAAMLSAPEAAALLPKAKASAALAIALSPIATELWLFCFTVAWFPKAIALLEATVLDLVPIAMLLSLSWSLVPSL